MVQVHGGRPSRAGLAAGQRPPPGSGARGRRALAQLLGGGPPRPTPVSVSAQSARIDDQRCPPPDVLPRGPTMPDEDFFSLIQRVQAKRMDEQRVDLAGSPEQEVGGRPEPRQQC
uniref:G-protein-signaling modulator 1-like n=1 Tax=Panthera onca TaxID=9690 RepID=UPI002953AB54